MQILRNLKDQRFFNESIYKYQIFVGIYIPRLKIQQTGFEITS